MIVLFTIFMTTIVALALAIHNNSDNRVLITIHLAQSIMSPYICSKL